MSHRKQGDGNIPRAGEKSRDGTSGQKNQAIGGQPTRIALGKREEDPPARGHRIEKTF